MNAGVTEKAMLYSRSRFSWELSEIGAAKPDRARLLREAPAAFRRLCVETVSSRHSLAVVNQPPSGGCVLKLNEALKRAYINDPAAFRRLCVETVWSVAQYPAFCQPPSGGCVLKLRQIRRPCKSVGTSRLQAAVC